MNQENINFNKKMLIANTIIQGTQAAIGLTQAAVGLGNAIFENKQRAALQAQRGNIAQVNAEIRQADIDGFNPYDENQNYVGYDGYVTRNGRTIGDMKAEITQGVGEHFKTQWATNRALENINKGFIDIELSAQQRLMERESAIKDKLMLSDLSDLKDAIIRGEVQYDLNGNEKNAETSVRDILAGYSMPESQRELLTRQFVDDVNIAKVRRDAENIATAGGGYAAAEAHIRAAGLSDDQEADLIKNMTQEHAVTMKGFEDHIQQIINQGRESGLSSSAISASLAGLAEKQTDPQKVDRINTYRNQLNNDKLELINQQLTNAVDYAVKTGDTSRIDAVYESAKEFMTPEQFEIMRIKAERQLIPSQIENEALRLAEYGTSASNDFLKEEVKNGNITQEQSGITMEEVFRRNNRLINLAETKAEEVYNQVFQETGSIYDAISAALNTGSENADVNQAVSRRVSNLQVAALNNAQAKRLTNKEFMGLDQLIQVRTDLENNRGNYINQDGAYETHMSEINRLIVNKQAEYEKGASSQKKDDIYQQAQWDVIKFLETDGADGAEVLAMLNIYADPRNPDRLTPTQYSNLVDQVMKKSGDIIQQASGQLNTYLDDLTGKKPEYENMAFDIKKAFQQGVLRGTITNDNARDEVEKLKYRYQAKYMDTRDGLTNNDIIREKRRMQITGALETDHYTHIDERGSVSYRWIDGMENDDANLFGINRRDTMNAISDTDWEMIGENRHKNTDNNYSGQHHFTLRNSNGEQVIVQMGPDGLLKQDGNNWVSFDLTQGRTNVVTSYYTALPSNTKQQLQNAIAGSTDAQAFYETIDRILKPLPNSQARANFGQFLLDGYGTDEWRRRMIEMLGAQNQSGRATAAAAQQAAEAANRR